MTKVIAFYLPQYHCIPENDKWWGEGFTEWQNTSKAKPLFKGQYQPKEPLNDNYYNLLDRSSREWQANLAKQYGVYGFCYYHYWFNGKLLLEKPLEEVLKLNEPDFPFCMCWANEPWTRAWDGGEKKVIMPQHYGGKKEWKEHFDYLLPFFLDKRYIRIKNKPVFIFYRSSSISNFDEMLKYWNELSVKNGLDGIYFIEELNSFQGVSSSNLSDALLQFEPMYTLRFDVDLNIRIVRKLKNILRKICHNSTTLMDTYSYKYVWNKIVNRDSNSFSKKTFHGAFVDWDNTARKKYNATVFKGATPKKFGNYLNIQLQKSENENKEFVFINAWNEWAEGTYLEPDKLNNYDYLTEIRKLIKCDKVE